MNRIKNKITKRLTFVPNCTDGKAFYNKITAKKVDDFLEDCYNVKYSYDEIKYILEKGLL